MGLQVVEKMKPLLRDGFYDDAVVQGLRKIQEILQKTSTPVMNQLFLQKKKSSLGAWQSTSQEFFAFVGCAIVCVAFLSEALTCGNGLIVAWSNMKSSSRHSMYS